MPADLDMMIFFPDGNAPELINFETASLAEKWKKLCGDMLDQLGPVFTQTLNGNLSHFGIQIAGPSGRLYVHRSACYEFGISRGLGTEQDQATIRHFQDFLFKACTKAGGAVSGDTLKALGQTEARPTLMMFDYCAADIGDDDKIAIGQLGIHLASAYFSYCERN